jgi:hypothetical protein
MLPGRIKQVHEFVFFSFLRQTHSFQEGSSICLDSSALVKEEIIKLSRKNANGQPALAQEHILM